MRTEKFDHTKDRWDNDDIAYAIEHNPQSNFLISDIDVIVAEVCGEAGGADWHWIIQRKDGKFQYVFGGCDYTGWDCQSSAKAFDPVDTVVEAVNQSPEKEEYGGDRLIRKNLMAQVVGEQPFAIYIS